MNKLATLLVMVALSTSHAHAGVNVDKKEAAKAGAAVVAGGAAGGAAFSTIGGAGLAIGGTALSIGAAPFVVVGATLGMAGYGIYRLFSGPAPEKVDHDAVREQPDD